MRSYRLSRLGTLVLAMLAVFAFGAIVATAAQAVEEAPRFSVAKKLLKKGESEEPSVTAVGSSTLTAGADVVTCTTLEVKKGAKLLGSEAGEAGTGEATLRYSGCTVTGNGTPCEVTSKEVETVALRAELVEDAATKKVLLVDFLPASGSLFTTLKFTGTGCTVKETKVTGKDVLAQVRTAGGRVVELGLTAEEALSWHAEVLKEQPPSFWLVKGGVGKTVTLEEAEKLMAFGVPAKLEGTAALALVSGKEWSPLP
ncbi:MAG TPA: hypothetical protein VNV42_07335 [Solirubrobacteraceae bacterium]|jgi:hypothetical protein|nr:hypothetical protein [Solirubrobacteraceae bacterium]